MKDLAATADAELTSRFDVSCQAIANGIERRDATIGDLCEALAMSTAEMESVRLEIEGTMPREWARLGSQCDFNRTVLSDVRRAA